MNNKEIIITREQAESLVASLHESLDNEGVYQIKINITDDAIMLTVRMQTVQTETRIQTVQVKLCSN